MRWLLCTIKKTIHLFKMFVKHNFILGLQFLNVALRSYNQTIIAIIVSILIPQMGNICCEDQPHRPQAVPIRSVAGSRSPPTRIAAKSQSQLRNQEQKQILTPFTPTLMWLSKNTEKQTPHHYQGYYKHNEIGNDQLSDYFSGTLIEDGGVQMECIIKRVSKQKLVSITNKRSLCMQYQLTRYLDHPFIVRCIHYHQDQNFLYIFFDLRNYQHLNVYTNKTIKPEHHTFFKTDLQNHIRFVIAGVILALQQLHQLSVVYRGINNENIIILEDGYPKITNLSKINPEGHKSLVSINVNPFTSLEQYRGQIITKSSDFWDLGVLIYYMCTGNYINFTTFKQKTFKGEGISLELTDLVNKLLILKQQDRLGMKNINDIKKHNFFMNFNWQAYLNKQLVSPFTKNKTQLQNEVLSHEYGQFNTFEHSDDNRMLAASLFLDIATIYLLMESFQGNQNQYENVETMEQVNNIDEDQFQLATAIDIAGDGIVNGGDYD